MTIDLEAYAGRIGYRGEFAPTLEVLRGLHYAHATHVPFENLDILLGRPIRLDLESLWNKLVRDRRGGYCFEQNGLFSAVLEACGFRLSRLAARVRLGATGIRPRTHMILMVDVDGAKWLTDVGFGGDGLLHPVAFRPDEVDAQFSWKYRLVHEGRSYVLQSARPEGWIDLYSFTLEEQEAIDYELGNYYTSTHPKSAFVNNLIAQLPGPDLRLTLVNRTLIERTAGGSSETTVPDDEALLDVLARRFSLEFPRGTGFRYESAERSAAFGR